MEAQSAASTITINVIFLYNFLGYRSNNLDPNIDSFMDLGTQFGYKLLTCLYINEVQCRLPVGVSEGQSQIAVDAHYICLVDERQREGFVPWNLVCVADNRQLLVVVTHFIGLKVNAVESAASNLPARLYVSNKFQVHIQLFSIVFVFVFVRNRHPERSSIGLEEAASA